MLSRLATVGRAILAAHAALMLLAGAAFAGVGVVDGTAEPPSDYPATLPAAAPGDTVAPSVTLFAPNTPVVWAMGATRKITWSATDSLGIARVTLVFSADSGATWQPIADSLANTGTYDWKVPNVRTTLAMVRVTARDDAGNAASDASDRVFTIRDELAPTMTVTTPNGGQIWDTGSSHKVTWKATDNVAVVRVDLSYSIDGGALWTTVASGLANTGSYTWTLPRNVATNNALFKAAAKDSAGNAASDVGNAPFAIRDTIAPVVTVTTPDGGQIWDSGSTHSVTWTATDNVRVTAIDLDWSRDGGATWIPLAASLPNSGSWAWTIPATPTPAALFRVTARDSMGRAAWDLGGASFTIRDGTPPQVTLIAPNGGEVWPTDSARTIVWTASDESGIAGADLDWSADGGQHWTTIVAGVAGSSFGWTAPLAPSTTARVRVVVRDSVGNAASDASDADFELRGPAPPPPADGPRRILCFRADSANGVGAYPTPGAASPWVDIAGSHNGALIGFHGNLASGWNGNGTPGHPRCLEFGGEEPGWNNHVSVAAGSIPELQTIGPVTAAVWFRTGNDGASSRYEYVLEWVQEPAVPYDPEFEGRGMSIIVQGGRIQAYANPWVDAGPAAPNTWYHVAVVKDTNDLRLYVNGERRFAGIKSHRGLQQSELALGASIFRRFEGRVGDAAFDDFFRGAIGEADLWAGALTDSAVHAAFLRDSALYLPAPVTPPDSAVVRLDAALADGAMAYAAGTAASPWVDLAAPRSDFGLVGFDGTVASGWQGDGTPTSPYRLQFDGVNDAVAVSAANVPELLAARGITASMRVRAGADPASSTTRYLMEWLYSFGASPGLSLAIFDGHLRLYAGSFQWADLGLVAADTWYDVTIVKQPGDLRAYVNQTLVYASASPNWGPPNSGIVLGASTWRGVSNYGEFFDGSIAAVTLWARALADSEIAGPALRTGGEVALEASNAVARPGLALAGVFPYPARGPLTVRFSLPSAMPARLELIDVSGRRVSVREVGSLGAGTHTITLGRDGALRSGVYWLRLAQGGRGVSRKAIVVE